MAGNGNTGQRAVHYIGPGHTRAIYEDRILDIRFKESARKYYNKVKNIGYDNPKAYAELPLDVVEKVEMEKYATRSSGAKKGAQTRKANRIQGLKDKKAEGSITREEEIRLYNLQGRKLPKRLLDKPKKKASAPAPATAPSPASKKGKGKSASSPSVAPASKKGKSGKGNAGSAGLTPKEKRMKKYLDTIAFWDYPLCQYDGSPLTYKMAKEAYECITDIRCTSRIARRGKGIIILDE